MVTAGRGLFVRFQGPYKLFTYLHRQCQWDRKK